MTETQNISLTLALNILKALGGDTSIQYETADQVWDAINDIYEQSGEKVDIGELILEITENGDYNFFGDDRIDAYLPVKITANVPQKYTDEQVNELVENARNEGVDAGYAEGYEQGNDEGFNEGYAEGVDDGYEDGVADQKEKLERITISENGTYAREDGYNEVVVKVAGEINFDFGVLGYDNTTVKHLNSDIATTTQNGIDYAVEIANKGISGTNASFKYSSDAKLIYFPMLDTSNVTNMNYMFYKCPALKYMPDLNTSKVTNFGNMFNECSLITTCPNIDTANATSVDGMFGNCTSLTTVPELNFGNVTAVGYLFGVGSNKNMVNLGGFKDFGKQPTISGNYSSYFIESSTGLTKESMLNIINKLYDRATAGYSVLTLSVGTTNLNKLTADEIAIATNKGWTLK